MKKLLIILSIFLVAVLLVGCAKKAEWSKAAPAGQDAPGVPQKDAAVVGEEETSLDADIAELNTGLSNEDISGLDAELDGMDEDLENI